MNWHRRCLLEADLPGGSVCMCWTGLGWPKVYRQPVGGFGSFRCQSNGRGAKGIV